MKKLLLAVAVASVFISAAVRAEPVVPEELPKDVALLVESADINAAGTELQKFVGQVAPGAMVPAPGMMLPQLFRTTKPATLDLSKPIQLLVMLPPNHEQPAVVFSVTDGDAYLESIPLEKKETDGKLNVFQGRGRDMFIGVEGKRAVMCESKEVAQKVMGMLGEGMFGGKRLLADGHVAMAVRPAALLGHLKEIGMDPFGLLRQQLQAQAAMAGDQGAQEAMKVVDIEVKAIQQLIEQTKGLSMALTFSQQNMQISKKAEPVEGSALAAYLDSIPDGELKTAKLMPADAMLFYGTKFGDFKPAFNWVRTALKEADFQAGDTDKIMAPMEKWVDAIGNEMSQAARATADGKLSAVGAVLMDDTANIDELLKGAGEMARAMAPFQQMANSGKVEINVTPNAETYNGVSIHEIAMAMELPEPGPNMPPQVLAMQKATFEMLGGLNSKSYSAVLDGVYVYSQGADSMKAIQETIDRDGGLEGASTLKTAREMAGDNAVMIGFVSVSEGVNFILDYVARQMGPNAPAPLQNIRMQPADPLTFSSGITDDGVVTGKLVLPASIGKAGFMAFMQLQQAMQGGGRPGGGPMLP